jgi:excisionase family DNA binding protein
MIKMVIMMIESDPRDLLRYKEVARYVGVHPDTVKRRVNRGDLEAEDTPFGKRIRRAEMERYLKITKGDQ